ncbi:MAG: TAT-variant-translocated molybdopterin oxidoreductase, partial [Ignavibacteriales bacterium]|nr:TAT-variant-translocated molybdopterin oxidoreductase [Ignavibacteriales bacterium]
MADNTNMQENYWKSIEELQGDELLKEARHQEFTEGVKEEFDPQKSLLGLSRRKFLALIGTSAALASAGCTDYPDKGEIVPYNRKPEEIMLGRPNYYASTCGSCANSCGVLIKTREGRPIKVDGNPDHPVNQGKVCAKGQAAVLNLYDPSRIVEPYLMRSGKPEITTWQVADTAVLDA